MNISPENCNIILASKSPRRKEILEKAGYTFDITAPNFELDINGKTYSDDLLLKCVTGKSASIEVKVQDYLLISADTVVVLDNIIIGKPKNEKEAYDILSKLSGKTHFVATGINLIHSMGLQKKEVSGIEKTYVTFKSLSDTEIIEYIKSAKPLDKAGAYGIQDPNFNFATKIDGNLDNVIGFPMTLFNKLLT